MSLARGRKSCMALLETVWRSAPSGGRDLTRRWRSVPCRTSVRNVCQRRRVHVRSSRCLGCSQMLALATLGPWPRAVLLPHHRRRAQAPGTDAGLPLQCPLVETQLTLPRQPQQQSFWAHEHRRRRESLPRVTLHHKPPWHPFTFLIDQAPAVLALQLSLWCLLCAVGLPNMIYLVL